MIFRYFPSHKKPDFPDVTISLSEGTTIYEYKTTQLIANIQFSILFSPKHYFLKPSRGSILYSLKLKHKSAILNRVCFLFNRVCTWGHSCLWKPLMERNKTENMFIRHWLENTFAFLEWKLLIIFCLYILCTDISMSYTKYMLSLHIPYKHIPYKHLHMCAEQNCAMKRKIKQISRSRGIENKHWNEKIWSWIERKYITGPFAHN